MRRETSLPVLNAYYEALEPQTISVTLGGRRRQTDLIPGDGDDVDDDAWRKITANFVHSTDACHLHMVVNAMTKRSHSIGHDPRLLRQHCATCQAIEPDYARAIRSAARERYL